MRCRARRRPRFGRLPLRRLGLPRHRHHARPHARASPGPPIADGADSRRPEHRPGPEPAPTSTRSIAEDGKTTVTPVIPKVVRHARLRLRLDDLPIAKTGNLRPYLFKVLQEEDAGARLTLTIDVTSGAGISEENLTNRIVEGLDQLGIAVTWEPS